MEDAIGKIVTLPDGRKARVTRHKGCDKCVYYKKTHNDYCYYVFCMAEERTDHNNIIYKEVK